MDIKSHNDPVLPRTQSSQILIPRSGIEIILEVLSPLIIGAGFVMILLYWSQLPDRVAIHFNLTGNPNGWAKRSAVFVVLIPAIIVYLFPTLIVLGIKPLSQDNTKSAEQYRLTRFFLSVIRFEILFFILVVEWVTIISAVNGALIYTGLLNAAAFGSVLFVTFAVYLFFFYRIKKT